MAVLTTGPHELRLLEAEGEAGKRQGQGQGGGDPGDRRGTTFPDVPPSFPRRSPDVPPSVPRRSPAVRPPFAEWMADLVIGAALVGALCGMGLMWLIQLASVR